MIKRVIVPVAAMSLYAVFGFLGTSPLWGDEAEKHSDAGALMAVGLMVLMPIGIILTAMIVEREKRSSPDLIFGWATVSFAILLIPAAATRWPDSAFGTVWFVGLWLVMWGFRYVLPILWPGPETVVVAGGGRCLNK